MTDFGEIDRMTPREYRLRMQAYSLIRLDRERDIAWQAWLNLIVRNTKGTKNPKPAYRTFKDFFDYEAEERKIRGAAEPDRPQTLADRWREYMRLHEDGKL